MKITNEEYKTVKTELNKIVQKAGKEGILEYYNNVPFANDKEKAFRWGLYHIANIDIFYGRKDISDNHIDTILRKYIREEIDVIG